MHQSILLTQEPICKILAKIARLLVVVEKLSFFESAIFILFKKKKNFCSILIQIYGVPMMVRNFGDYPDLQQKARGYKIMSHTVCTWVECSSGPKLLIKLSGETMSSR